MLQLKEGSFAYYFGTLCVCERERVGVVVLHLPMLVVCFASLDVCEVKTVEHVARYKCYRRLINIKG